MAYVKEEYERGLNTAWGAFKEIIAYSDGGLYTGGLRPIFGVETVKDVAEKFTASEAVNALAEFKAREKRETEMWARGAAGL